MLITQRSWETDSSSATWLECAGPGWWVAQWCVQVHLCVHTWVSGSACAQPAMHPYARVHVRTMG